MLHQNVGGIGKSIPDAREMSRGRSLMDISWIEDRGQRLVTFWDIWSEWWGDMTWPKNRQWQRQIQIQRQRLWQRQRQWQRQMHLESTFKERSQRLVTFETFDKSDEGKWRQWQQQIQRQRQKHFEKTFRVQPTDSKETSVLKRTNLFQLAGWISSKSDATMTAAQF